MGVQHLIFRSLNLICLLFTFMGPPFFLRLSLFNFPIWLNYYFSFVESWCQVSHLFLWPFSISDLTFPAYHHIVFSISFTNASVWNVFPLFALFFLFFAIELLSIICASLPCVLFSLQCSSPPQFTLRYTLPFATPARYLVIFAPPPPQSLNLFHPYAVIVDNSVWRYGNGLWFAIFCLCSLFCSSLRSFVSFFFSLSIPLFAPLFALFLLHSLLSSCFPLWFFPCSLLWVFFCSLLWSSICSLFAPLLPSLLPSCSLLSSICSPLWFLLCCLLWSYLCSSVYSFAPFYTSLLLPSLFFLLLSLHPYLLSFLLLSLHSSLLPTLLPFRPLLCFTMHLLVHIKGAYQCGPCIPPHFGNQTIGCHAGGTVCGNGALRCDDNAKCTQGRGYTGFRCKVRKSNISWLIIYIFYLFSSIVFPLSWSTYPTNCPIY